MSEEKKYNSWDEIEDAHLLQIIHDLRDVEGNPFDEVGDEDETGKPASSTGTFWNLVSKTMLQRYGHRRTAKQTRERYRNSLDPSINKESWSLHEDLLLTKWHNDLGNRWSLIAKKMPGRTENGVKTRFKSIQRARKRQWKPSEDRLLLSLYRIHGPKWSVIKKSLPNRSLHGVKTRHKALISGTTEKEISPGSPEQSLPYDWREYFEKHDIDETITHGSTFTSSSTTATSGIKLESMPGTVLSSNNNNSNSGSSGLEILDDVDQQTQGPFVLNHMTEIPWTAQHQLQQRQLASSSSSSSDKQQDQEASSSGNSHNNNGKFSGTKRHLITRLLDRNRKDSICSASNFDMEEDSVTGRTHKVQRIYYVPDVSKVDVTDGPCVIPGFTVESVIQNKRPRTCSLGSAPSTIGLKQSVSCGSGYSASSANVSGHVYAKPQQDTMSKKPAGMDKDIYRHHSSSGHNIMEENFSRTIEEMLHTAKANDVDEVELEDFQTSLADLLRDTMMPPMHHVPFGITSSDNGKH